MQCQWVDTYELPAPLGPAAGRCRPVSAVVAAMLSLRLPQDAAIIRDGGPPCAWSGEDAVGTASGTHFLGLR
jgi:hypothetical protein